MTPEQKRDTIRALWMLAAIFALIMIGGFVGDALLGPDPAMIAS